METDKPVKGYFTTEFWLTLGAQGLALLVLFGFISEVDQKDLYASLAKAIEQLGALALSLGSIWKYIQSRTVVKAEVSTTKAAIRLAQLMPQSFANRSIACLLIMVLACPAAFAADYNFIIKDGKYYLINKADPSQPNKLVTVQFTNIEGTGGGGPVDPPPGNQTPFEKMVSKLTSEALQAGGTPTTAAALSGVFSMVSEAVGNGEIKPEKAIAAVGAGTRLVMNNVDDDAHWSAFRTTVADTLDTLEQDRSLRTSAEYAKILKEISNGMNSVTGFNGSVSAPAQVDAGPNAGIFGDITIEKILEIFKLLLELFKTFKGG